MYDDDYDDHLDFLYGSQDEDQENEYSFEDALDLVTREYPASSQQAREEMAAIVLRIVENEDESPERALLFMDTTYKKYFDKQ